MGAFGELVHLAGGEQVAAYAVVVAGGGLERGGGGAGLLYVAEAAVCVDVLEHAGPRFGDDGAVGFGVEDAVVDAPGHAEGDEGRAGDFGLGVGGGVEEAGAPEAVGALDSGEGCGHFAELVLVEA